MVRSHIVLPSIIEAEEHPSGGAGRQLDGHRQPRLSSSSLISLQQSMDAEDATQAVRRLSQSLPLAPEGRVRDAGKPQARKKH